MIKYQIFKGQERDLWSTESQCLKIGTDARNTFHIIIQSLPVHWQLWHLKLLVTYRLKCLTIPSTHMFKSPSTTEKNLIPFLYNSSVSADNTWPVQSSLLHAWSCVLLKQYSCGVALSSSTLLATLLSIHFRFVNFLLLHSLSRMAPNAFSVLWPVKRCFFVIWCFL